MLLVLAFAFATPAFASPPSEMSGTTVVANLMTGQGIVTGDWEGTLSHSFTQGRADQASFVGCVADRCGEFEMLLVLQQTEDPGAPGLEGKWTILHGSDGLENLRGQGTFVIDLALPFLTMTLDGQYHFDPDRAP
jgi:hypothetical protein